MRLTTFPLVLRLGPSQDGSRLGYAWNVSHDMIPAIGLVLNVEMIRDGGSLAATFLGSNGAEYWLLFKVKAGCSLPTAGDPLSYEEPVVLERQPGIAVQISWEHARILLNQIRRDLRDPHHQEWWSRMAATADARAQLHSSSRGSE